MWISQISVGDHGLVPDEDPEVMGEEVSAEEDAEREHDHDTEQDSYEDGLEFGLPVGPGFLDLVDDVGGVLNGGKAHAG